MDHIYRAPARSGLVAPGLKSPLTGETNVRKPECWRPHSEQYSICATSTDCDARLKKPSGGIAKEPSGALQTEFFSAIQTRHQQRNRPPLDLGGKLFRKQRKAASRAT